MPNLQQLSASQSSPEVPINENFISLQHQAVYGKNPATTSGLVWGYLGGEWGGFAVAAGTLTLTNSVANYIVAAVATGVMTGATTTTNWNDVANYKRAFKITPASGAITEAGTNDYRAGPGGVHGTAPGTAGSLTTDTDGTLAANSDLNVATQKATKTYVDTKLDGRAWKQVVRAATTANGTLATAYANGQTIDGVTLVTGDRILVKNQTSGSENGFYIVAASGAPTRSTDADTGPELVNSTCYVSEGSTLADTQWTCSTNATITVGSTALVFVQMASGTYQPLDSDLTTIAALTATTDSFMQAKSSAWASRTVAQVSADLQGTGLLTDAVGYRTIPQNSQSTAYTTVAADAGKHLLHPSADTTARTFTIDSNANVPYPIGTPISFVNQNGGGVISIAITSDTMRLAGPGTTGTRSLAANGIATAVKITSTEWIISGTGLT